MIGRLPMICGLHELSDEALLDILQNPKNALCKQYKKLFKMEDVELEFEEEALKAIVEQAKKRKTGARGLRSIIEELLIDLMFETPDMKDLKKIIINYEVVTKKSLPILLFSNKLNTERLSSLHQLDFRIDKIFYLKKSKINLYLDVQNVYNFQIEAPPYLTIMMDEQNQPLLNQENNHNISGSFLYQHQ